MSRFLAKINEMAPDIVTGDEGQRVMAKNELLRYLKDADIQVKDKEYGGDTIIVSCNGKDIHLTVTNVTDTSNALQDGEDEEIDPVTGAVLTKKEKLQGYDSPQANAAIRVGGEMEKQLTDYERRLKSIK